MNNLTDYDKYIYKKLIDIYPDKVIHNLTKSEYYSYIYKVAKDKGITSKEYINYLGFTIQNKKMIFISENELVERLNILFPNKEYISIDSIKKDYKEEIDAIKYYTKVNNFKRTDQYLQEKGFYKVGKKTNNFKKGMDIWSLNRLINEYDTNASELARMLNCTRQNILKKVNDVNNISAINKDGWIQPYTESEIYDVIQMINDKQYYFKDEIKTIYICSNKVDFKRKAIVYIKGEFIKCIFNCNHKIETELRNNYFDILDQTVFEIIKEIDSNWKSQGRVVTNGNKIVEIDSALRSNIHSTDLRKNIKIKDILKLFDFKIKDKRITVTEEGIVETIKKYVINDNVVRIKVKDQDYFTLTSYASKNNYGGIKELVNHFGFEYKTGKDDSNIIDKHKKTIKERYIVYNNFIYISSYDPFYNTLNGIANKRKMSLLELLKDWGFNKINNKYELPEDYTPYDYKEDLKKQLSKKWDDDNLKLVLESLSNDYNEVYLDITSYFYYIIFLVADSNNLTIDDLVKSLGYKRILNKTEYVECKSNDIKKLLYANEKDYIASKIENLKSIESEYKQEMDIKIKISRNKKLVKCLKELYQGKCQLCGGDEPQIPVILKHNGDIYSEVHHITSFSNIQSDNDEIDEIDSYKNTIVLCPYHHKLVHFKNKGFKELFISKNEEAYLVGEDGERIKLNLNYHIGK